MKLIKNIPQKSLLELYVAMRKIRKFEEKLVPLLFNKEIKCPVHLCIGQEAVAVGVCSNLKKEDYVFSTHRSHGHYIAKGGDLKQLMAELYGRKTGCSRGRGGSMHLVAPEVGFLGSSSIVAGSLPLSVGTALASSIKRDGRVSVAFFGDGATDEGVFHESLNFASLKKLPIVFICENNLFSTHLRLCYRQVLDNIYKKAQGYGMHGIRIDGNNVLEVFQASREAIKNVRQGKGPVLIECRTYRWLSHVGPWEDLDVGRTKEEVDAWKKRCPIKKFERFLLKNRNLTESKKKQICKKIDEETEQTLNFAKRSPFPDGKEAKDNVYAEN